MAFAFTAISFVLHLGFVVVVFLDYFGVRANPYKLAVVFNWDSTIEVGLYHCLLEHELRSNKNVTVYTVNARLFQDALEGVREVHIAARVVQFVALTVLMAHCATALARKPSEDLPPSLYTGSQ